MDRKTILNREEDRQGAGGARSQPDRRVLAEIAATIAYAGLPTWMRRCSAPPMAGRTSRVPFPSLQDWFMVNAEKIVEAARKLAAY